MNKICQQCPEKCKQDASIKMQYCPNAPKELFTKQNKIKRKLKGENNE